MLRVAWSVPVLAERDTMRRKAVCSSPVLARRARKNLEEQHPHRSFAPGVRTQDQLDCEVKGGAPSTGAVGPTRVPFLKFSSKYILKIRKGGARSTRAMEDQSASIPMR